MKGVYIFLANGFEEMEALAPLDILRRGGVEVKTVSIHRDKYVTGSHKATVVADMTYDEFKAEVQLDGTEENDVMIFCRLECLEYAGTAGDNRNIGTLVNFNGFTQFKAVVCILVKNAVESAVNSDVERTGRIICRHNRVVGFVTVGGADNGKVGD